MTLVDGETPAFTLDGAEILYSVPGRILAMPGRGGAPREVTRVSGKVLDVRVGPDRRIHFMVVGGQGPEAWSAPVAGGSSERELPAPWTEVVPAPRGDWRAVTHVVDAGARRVRGQSRSG